MKKKRKYIYLEKCLIICILQIYIFSFYDFLFFISLSYLQLTQGSTWYVQGYNGYLYLGAGSTNSIKIDSAGNLLSPKEITAYSDIRLKKNIRPLENRGYILPIVYERDGKQSIGFSAQEVRELYPELVIEDNTEDKYLSVNYAQYVAVLQAQIIDLKKEIDELKNIKTK